MRPLLQKNTARKSSMQSMVKSAKKETIVRFCFWFVFLEVCGIPILEPVGQGFLEERGEQHACRTLFFLATGWKEIGADRLRAGN